MLTGVSRTGTTSSTPTPTPPAARRRHLLLGLLGGGAVLAAVTVLATSARPSLPEVSELTVVLTDAASPGDASCPADAYEGTFLDGPTLEVEADGTVLAATTLSGDGEPSALGCSWAATLTGLPGHETYSVTVRGRGVPPREHVYQYSAEELAARDGVVRVSVLG